MSSRRGTSTRGGKSSGTATPGPADLHPRRPAARDEPDTADADRPDTWEAGDVALPLSYRFEPGAADDGVTVHVPVDVLARLGGDEFAWQVPALREELVTALIRSLPKDLRRNFVPAPDTARAVLAAIDPAKEPLLDALQRELRRRTGILVPIDAFDLDKLPAHLRVTFAVESADGAEIARGKDLGALQEQLATPAQRAVADVQRRRRAGADRTAQLARRPGRTAASRRAHGRADVPCAAFPRSSTREAVGPARVCDGGRAGRRDGPGHPTLSAAERRLACQSG